MVTRRGFLTGVAASVLSTKLPLPSPLADAVAPVTPKLGWQMFEVQSIRISNPAFKQVRGKYKPLEEEMIAETVRLRLEDGTVLWERGW